MKKVFFWLIMIFIVFPLIVSVIITLNEGAEPSKPLSADEQSNLDARKAERKAAKQATLANLDARKAERKAAKQATLAARAEKERWSNMGIVCAQLFENASKYGTRLSFHRDQHSIEKGVFQMYWSPQYFKIKNAFGTWQKSEAYCYLIPKDDVGKKNEVILLQIGTKAIVDNR